jgi:hypothetical protein
LERGLHLSGQWLDSTQRAGSTGQRGELQKLKTTQYRPVGGKVAYIHHRGTLQRAAAIFIPSSIVQLISLQLSKMGMSIIRRFLNQSTDLNEH